MKIAHLDTTVLDNAAKFFRVMGNAGADFTGPMQDKRKRANLVRFLQRGCPEVDELGAVHPTVPASMAVAKALLGDNFISPDELNAQNVCCRYTLQQLSELAKSLPSLLAINWLRENDYFLMPGPAVTMTLRNIYQEFREHFQQTWTTGDGPWFMHQEHEFLATDVVKPATWLAVYKKSSQTLNQPQPNTDEEDDIRHQALLMNAAEVTYVLAACAQLRGVDVFSFGWSKVTESRLSPRVPVQVMMLKEGVDVFTV
jgi:hypothetical protein